MSDAIETVRTIYGAFARGDVPAVMAYLATDIEWVTPPTLPWSKGRYRGHDGVGDYFSSFIGALGDPHIDVQEVVQQGDRVISLGVERATAKSTGRSFAARFAHVWTLESGKVTLMEGIIDTASVRGAFDA